MQPSCVMAGLVQDKAGHDARWSHDTRNSVILDSRTALRRRENPSLALGAGPQQRLGDLDDLAALAGLGPFPDRPDAVRIFGVADEEIGGLAHQHLGGALEKTLVVGQLPPLDPAQRRMRRADHPGQLFERIAAMLSPFAQKNVLSRSRFDGCTHHAHNVRAVDGAVHAYAGKIGLTWNVRVEYILAMKRPPGPPSQLPSSARPGGQASPAPRRRSKSCRTRPKRPGTSADPASLAKAALARFRRAGDKASETTTPERLLRAGGMARVERFSRAVEVQRRGRMETRTVEARRIRIEDSPFARLRARNLLASGADAEVRNALLAAAADRYRQHWHYAGLGPLHAIDPSRERVSGTMVGLLRTERQLAHFQAYGAAVRVLGEDARRIVEAVVLHDREPVDVGRELSGYRQEKQATAVALYVLRAGLRELAVHFGLMKRGP